jgi:lipoprotein-anchoring transpeptidase ErfK/SrfK
MSGRRREMLGLGALVIGLTTIAITDRASAQYYCDERLPASCPGYHQPPPPPPLPFPFGLFQPREIAPPPEPSPRQAPVRPGPVAPPVDPGLARQYAALYAPVNGEPFPIAAVRLSDIDPAYLRKAVHFPTSEAPGTIIIDAQNRFLYFVQGGGRAIRYGVGVGRQGFGWAGVATIRDKQEWPDWYPPKEMIARQADLRRQLSELQGGLGMPGGPRNPLGARAMYLWQGNKDTLYRIHGTFEPWTIGSNVSSGCIRMINQDVIDLYERVPLGAKVVVLPARSDYYQRLTGGNLGDSTGASRDYEGAFRR